MKKMLKVVIVIYGLSCLMLTCVWGYNSYYTTLINNSPFYVGNRDSTMGLFFKKWDEINSTYDPLLKDETPRWYDEIKKPLFVTIKDNKLNEALQEERAKEYVRQHIKGAMGIDHKKAVGM